ncbi:MAG TPA: type II CAAX endopeptidase family protein [Candidatus Nitrosotalea sp.]|nr:type II CAAX endopeptidase family protein [Candidatus Nitrosotalea sp.]
MNDSTSATLPVWPTRWPKNSFSGVWTWLIAGFIGGLFIAVFLIGVLKPPATPAYTASESYLIIGVQVIIDVLLIALVLATLPFLSRFSLRELGFRVPNRRALIVALVGFAAMVVVANGSETLIDLITKHQHPQDVVQLFLHLHDPVAIAVFAIFAVIFTPIAEETLFRVFFFNLGLRYGGFWGGAILSGVLFGIAHGDPYAAIPLALGGIVLCAVYYRSENAYASMISHGLFNALSIVALLFGPKVS